MSGQGGLSGHQLGEPAGDLLLGSVQASEERARRVLHGVGDDGAFGQLQIESGADGIAGHVEQLGGQRAELVHRESAVALLRRLVQRVADAGAHPARRGLLDAQLHRDGVGRLESDAADLAREVVGASA